MEGESIVALGDLHQDRIFGTLTSIVFRQFSTQTPSLHPDHGIYVGIKVLLPPKDFGGNLVLLRRSPRMLQGMVGQIAEQLAERL
jgi:hypothetical protein